MLAGRLTKSGIEHIQCHLIALLCARDCNQALVAVVGGLIDLDNATAQLSDFIDLSTTFTNDSSDHIIRNVDLLCEWLQES